MQAQTTLSPMVAAFTALMPNITSDAGAWEHISAFYNAGAMDFDSVADIVGVGPAAEFFSFVEKAGAAPSVEQVLADSTGTPVPESVAGQFYLVTRLARAANRENSSTIMEYVTRMNPEFVHMFCRDAITAAGEVYPAIVSFLLKAR